MPAYRQRLPRKAISKQQSWLPLDHKFSHRVPIQALSQHQSSESPKAYCDLPPVAEAPGLPVDKVMYSSSERTNPQTEPVSTHRNLLPLTGYCSHLLDSKATSPDDRSSRQLFQSEPIARALFCTLLLLAPLARPTCPIVPEDLGSLHP